jgi:hypothetical protein
MKSLEHKGPTTMLLSRDVAARHRGDLCLAHSAQPTDFRDTERSGGFHVLLGLLALSRAQIRRPPACASRGCNLAAGH